MNYIAKPYTETALNRLMNGENITLDGTEYLSLRAHVRRALEHGELPAGCGITTGTQIANLRKAACIALLLGQVPQAEQPQPQSNGAKEEKAPLPLPKAPEPQPANGHAIQPAPVPVPSNAADAVGQALSVLAGAFGGKVSSEEIKQQVSELTTPHLEKLAALNVTITETLKGIAEENSKLRRELLAGRPVLIEVKLPERETRQIGREHFLFPIILKLVAARCHGYLAGPAGSFKTSTAHAAARALELPFYATSVCQQTTKTDLLGFFVPGTGEYMPTDFRRAFEHGGVFLLDEIDAGNPNVLAVLNAALANDYMGFPDGMIKRHADFILLAAGNTYGTGADREYVGRNQLDAATLDRFAFLDFPYDEGLEAERCGIPGIPSPVCDIAEGGAIMDANEWFRRVQSVRHAGAKQKVRAVFSTRASFMGIALAKVGVGRAWLERMLLWKGMDAATKAKVEAGI